MFHKPLTIITKWTPIFKLTFLIIFITAIPSMCTCRLSKDTFIIIQQQAPLIGFKIRFHQKIFSMDAIFLESKEMEGNMIGDKQDIMGRRPIQTLKPKDKKFKFYCIKYLQDLKVMGSVHIILLQCNSSSNDILHIWWNCRLCCPIIHNLLNCHVIQSITTFFRPFS